MLIWKFLYISINAQIYLSNLSIYSQSGIDSLCCICVIISLILAYIFQVDFSRVYSHQYSSRFLLESHLICFFLRIMMLNNFSCAYLSSIYYLLSIFLSYHCHMSSLNILDTDMYFVNTFCNFVVWLFIFVIVFFEEHLKMVLNMPNFPDIKVVTRNHQQQCMEQKGWK